MKNNGKMAESLTDYMGQYHDMIPLESEVSVLQENLFYRNVEYIIYIPEYFTEKCIEGQEMLEVTKVPGSYSSYYVDQQINSFLNNAKVYFAAGFTETEAAEALQKKQEVSVHMLDQKQEKPSTGFHFYYQYLPYLFLSVCCYVLGNVFLAFGKGNLRKRSRASALTGFRQNLEGMLAAVVLGGGIWCVCTLMAFVIYGREEVVFGEKLFFYLINSVVMLLVSLALAYLVGNVIHNSNALSGVTNVISLGMCFLCGVFLPLEILAPSVRKAAQLLPVYWYEKANDMLSESGVLSVAIRLELWKSIGMQFLFAATLACVTLAIAKWKQRKAG